MDVRGPRRRYGRPTAVDGLGLGIRRGEVSGLLGPDGAGGCTEVEILQGDRDRDAGEVSVPRAGPGDRHARVPLPGRNRLAGRIGARRVDVRETVRHIARTCPLLRNPGAVIGLAGPEPKANGRIRALPDERPDPCAAGRTAGSRRCRANGRIPALPGGRAQTS